MLADLESKIKTTRESLNGLEADKNEKVAEVSRQDEKLLENKRLLAETIEQLGTEKLKVSGKKNGVGRCKLSIQPVHATQ